ncbi:hypothetical protein KAJ83_15035 [Marivibrio halodurans]|uniref:Formate dehydrogenase region TAT target n=1 Tax=Marivibrio halodurans TaxID=2039722 RepID=A0A8J7V517_9PROT|nr:hypothetical protein [Marivibrio halodurans]MBP5858334.1 hypothetical protein [Marivibrio halodurans]
MKTRDTERNPVRRRDVLKFGAFGGAAAVASVAFTGEGEAASAEEAPAKGKGSYVETAHISAYYNSTRF